MKRWLARPLLALSHAGLATRITAASLLVALGTVLLLGLGSAYLLHRQQLRAQQAIAEQLLSEQAVRAGDRLDAVHERLQQAATSSLIATALVDSAGKELFLQPYLQQLGQVGGVPVAVLFADFEGQPIASGRGVHFDAAQLHWLAESVRQGQPAVALFSNGPQLELAFITLVRYARTAAPEGALLARVRLVDLVPDPHYELTAGPGADAIGGVAPLATEAQFAPLQLGVRRRPGTLQPPPPDEALRPVLAMLALALVLAVATGRFLAQRLTRDLNTLVAHAARLRDAGPDAGGPTRLPRARTPEIELVNQRINAMLDALEQAHRNRIEAEQARAAQALSEAANRQKSVFMARVSHELRTPLNAILGFSDLLQRLTPLEPRQREWVQHIQSSGQHLLALVNDLLDISRIESGALEMQLGSVDTAELLHAAARDLDTLARRCEVSVQVALPGDAPPVRADATRLRQVVQNLLSNAIKYNRPGGHVRLHARHAGEDVELVVEDDGLGMDEAQLAQLFQPFNRLGRERSRIEGSGIGLALSRSLVESMHGAIVVDSRPGQGSRFTVRLPRATEAPAQAQAA